MKLSQHTSINEPSFRLVMKMEPWGEGKGIGGRRPQQLLQWIEGFPGGI